MSIPNSRREAIEAISRPGRRKQPSTTPRSRCRNSSARMFLAVFVFCEVEAAFYGTVGRDDEHGNSIAGEGTGKKR
jgi:hypothetical protein